ncbi:MAG: hypothetical protein ABW095_03570 [Candidatus Thiodiazotropha sp.]
MATLIQDPLECFYVHPSGHYPWSVEQIEQLCVTREQLQASLRSHERFWDIQVHQNRFDL